MDKLLGKTQGRDQLPNMHWCVAFVLRQPTRSVIFLVNTLGTCTRYTDIQKNGKNFRFCLFIEFNFGSISKFRLDQRNYILAPAIRNFHTIYYSENYLKN